MQKHKHYQSMRQNLSVGKTSAMATMAFAGLAGLTSLLSCPAKAANTAEIKVDVNVGTVLSLVRRNIFPLAKQSRAGTLLIIHSI